MINLVGQTHAAAVEACLLYRAHPGDKALGASPNAAGAWVGRVWQRLATRWCRQRHRRHHQRVASKFGDPKVVCSCCGKQFIRLRAWRKFNQNIF